ncbi:hypothetical protein [Microlunatus sp. Y2014]|uniref:hypothetical protein n=1 Tax=Microlunatus sp. Y2014 TaxID=3418488 RepID=UPI003DA6E092
MSDPAGPARRAVLGRRAPLVRLLSRLGVLGVRQVGDLRAWLVLLLVLGMSLTYALLWGAWVEQNTDQVYVQTAPGATVTYDGVALTVLAIRTHTDIDQGFSDPTTPTPGASWVVVELQVTGNHGEVRNRCRFNLLGPDGRLWEPMLRYDDLPDSCDEDVPATPTTVHLTYEVPEAYLGSLYGIVLDEPAREVQVLRP